jgi:hypothetical protein
MTLCLLFAALDAFGLRSMRPLVHNKTYNVVMIVTDDSRSRYVLITSRLLLASSIANVVKGAVADNPFFSNQVSVNL